MIRRPPRSPLFPSTPLFRSRLGEQPPGVAHAAERLLLGRAEGIERRFGHGGPSFHGGGSIMARPRLRRRHHEMRAHPPASDRKSTRLNSSHANISYAVFCLK